VTDLPSISPVLCAAGRALASPRLSPNGDWVAFAVRDGAGARLTMVPVAGGPELIVAVDPPPAAGPGCFDWTPDSAGLVYATGDGRLCLVPATGGPARTVVQHEGEHRLSAPAVSPDGTRVAYVVDDQHVVVAPLDGSGAVTLTTTADFAFDPAWSPDSRLVAWHEWDVPAMPWDEGRIAVRPADASQPAHMAAGGPGVAVQQPRFSPDGRLGYLSDATGWLNLWVDDRPVLAEDYEHGDPAWGQGQRSWCWSPDGRAVVLARNEAGFGRLVHVDVGSGTPTDLAKAVHESLSWSGDRVAAVRTGARTPTGIVVVDPATGARALLARGPVGGFEPALAEPAPVDAPVPARLTHPPEGRPRHGLIVWVHGGPTGQRRVAFDPRAAFFLDRGWSILHVDYRGSTGWGRAHQQALLGGWGEVDVDDIAAATVAAGADPTRTVAMGGSSGGMAVLLLLARHPTLFAAGIALYPVADLLDLAASTHRFEAHYTWSLIGPLPGAEALYRERSPLTHASRITAPLLLLHGSADEVVPVAQTEALADALRAAGRPVELHVYEGEGHGWRRSGTIADELQRAEAFLARRMLGFSQ
jgi:dipeptidyl aminopeptidase/acylaminoacyl peptidase